MPPLALRLARQFLRVGEDAFEAKTGERIFDRRHGSGHRQLCGCPEG